MDKKGEDVDIIQRRCGERTQDIYLDTFTGAQNIDVVYGEDLLDAVIKCLKIASKKDDGWTLFIDADVMLYDGAVYHMDRFLNTLPEEIIDIGFAYDDKFLVKPIYGVHAHRNTHIKELYEWFIKYASIGPKSESKNLKKFYKEKGYISIKKNLVVGNHDFEQYNYDIFNKSVIRGVRQRKRIDLFISYLEAHEYDSDIRVAIQGLLFSKDFPLDTNCSRNNELIKEGFTKLDIQEKNKISKKCLNVSKYNVLEKDIFEYSDLIFFVGSC